MKNVKEKLKHACAVFFVLLFLGLFCKALNYVTEYDFAYYTRIMMHELYDQEEIDYLFLGPSHCMRAFDTAVLDDALGGNSFNAGSANQNLDCSFLLMQEAVKNVNVKNIFVDLSLGTALNTNDKYESTMSTYLITDFMKPSLRKMVYLMNFTTPEHYVNTFFPARREWKGIFNTSTVAETLRQKNTDTYRNFDTIVHGTDSYAGKGFIASTVIEPTPVFTYVSYDGVNTDKINAKWIETIYDMVDFCKKNEINLTFVSVPVMNFLELYYGNYEEYILFINNILKETGVEYIDFNLLKDEYWSDDGAFMDSSHLNMYGAEKFSEIFASLVSGKVQKSELLYDSEDDAATKGTPIVYGVAYKPSEDDESKRQCRIVYNSNRPVEFTINTVSDSGAETVIHELDSQQEFIIPTDFSGKIIIEYKCLENESQSVSINI